jgi:transposase
MECPRFRGHPERWVGSVRLGGKDAPPCRGGSNFKRPYASEFRREGVELYRRGGRPLAEVAHDLGIATGSLRSWVKQAGIDAGVRDGLSSEEREELRRLRRENRLLREEREVLRKAAAFFARESETR